MHNLSRSSTQEGELDSATIVWKSTAIFSSSKGPIKFSNAY